MLKGKNVLIIGSARSGLDSALLALSLGGSVTINDANKDIRIANPEKYTQVKWDLGGPPHGIENFDLVILSPGVPTDLSFIIKAKKLGIKTIGALEFGYQHTEGEFYGITGTNGKTTTTQLTYEIFLQAGLNAFAVGNIGKPVSGLALDNSKNKHLITELSSFQLESIESFRPKIACIINITPDHLNRHKTMANYFAAKCRIYENQTKEDFLLLNDEDETLKKISNQPSQVYYFSKKPLDQGFFIEEDKIMVNLSLKEEIMSIKDIKIVGKHNLENVLAAVGIAYLAGISKEHIKAGVSAFKGVEHRIEFVGEFKGISCYNDSKGTNPEASIVAVESMAKPTVLIAGGMDKGSDFSDLSEYYTRYLSHLILLGETKEVMKQEAYNAGFYQVSLVETMEEAVEKAFELVKKEGSILLSPACASWDMYENFEIRGQHFKTCIEKAKL